MQVEEDRGFSVDGGYFTPEIEERVERNSFTFALRVTGTIGNKVQLPADLIETDPENSMGCFALVGLEKNRGSPCRSG
jgi:hypothetical protein